MWLLPYTLKSVPAKIHWSCTKVRKLGLLFHLVFLSLSYFAASSWKCTSNLACLTITINKSPLRSSLREEWKGWNSIKTKAKLQKKLHSECVCMYIYYIYHIYIYYIYIIKLNLHNFFPKYCSHSSCLHMPKTPIGADLINKNGPPFSTLVSDGRGKAKMRHKEPGSSSLSFVLVHHPCIHIDLGTASKWHNNIHKAN